LNPEPALIDTSQGKPSVLAGRYAVVREVGRGGMATVYLARDQLLGTDVAVKMLSPDLGPQLGAERFTREIRITASLQHPGILPVLDSGEAEGRPFYVMPFVVGESLAERVRREGQLPIPEALELTCQVADALAVAHRHGFVHRDIKPSNILLAGDRALLADFGIARAIDVLTNDKLTESGVALGTAAYMSPEQASGGRIDGRSDIYGLGCVLFEMLAGGPPFSGGSSQSVRARHVVDPVPSLRTVRDTVTPSLERIIVKAMAKAPADRYHDAEAFSKALRRVDLTETAPAVRAPARRRRLLPALAVVAAIVAGVVAWRLTLHRQARLDANHVMVFPLVIPAEFTGPRAVGEDVATMIGNALDGVGPLRWIDGWPLLDPAQRNDIRSFALASARALARGRRCAFFVTGRLVERGDSVEVFLELNDVAGDSVVARGKAVGTVPDAWRLGLRAVNEVLPALIPTGAPDVAAEWKERDPGAVASYLLGEAAFRRLHLGDALVHYRDAVKADSRFGLAAIRGAQAATWNHRSSEAAAFIGAALRLPLSPRYTHFAFGYAAYLEGRADSAAAEFHRALAIDPEMTVAWMQLGEVYTHLLPEAGRVDSLAEDALETAHRLDPRATNVLLHLIEYRLRQGDTSGAAPLVTQFLATTSDTATMAAQVRVSDRCVRDGPASVSWRDEGAGNALAILTAGHELAGGARPSCAEAALAAVMRVDTTRAGDLRWFALLELQALLLAQGRTADAVAAIGAAPKADDAPRMYLLDGAVYPAVAARASAAALEYGQRCGRSYTGCASSYLVWQLGVWASQTGQSVLAGAAASELERRARAGGNPDGARAAGILARSAAAHAALVTGDTTTAFRLLEALLEEAVPGGEEIYWNIALPRGLDRLAFARLLSARGDYRRTIAVADVFDSPAPSVYLLYLPESLRVRADAAAALGERSLAESYQARLTAFRGSSTVATHAAPTSEKGGTP
jgi:tRNA A-37 threonylcarbamoyl transferase component Bud32/tetratricopeptide (TPR) repeat protein